MTSATRSSAAATKVGVSATAFVPGVWGTALPFPSPLAYSFGYLVAVDRGVIAVDLGWNSDASWDAFTLGITRSGAALEDLVGVVVSHVHPDHFGLAARVRESTGAWIAMHPAEVPHIVTDAAQSTKRVNDMTVWLSGCGVPQEVLTEIHAEEAELHGSFATQLPDVLLEDGDTVPDSGGSLVAWHTPGHTPGHLCFRDEQRNVVFTGDHVLPRVTPNVSRRPGYGDDPLAVYATSLAKMGKIGSGGLVLPGHEWAFDSLKKRLDFLQNHQDSRSREVFEVVAAGGEQTVWEVTKALRWSRPFESLVSRGRRQAVGETHAHLHLLRNRGQLNVSTGTPERWSVVPR